MADELAVIGPATPGTRGSGQRASVLVVGLDGSRRTVVDSAAGLRTLRAPRWSDDGRSIYFTAIDGAGNRGVYRVPATGGTPVLVVAFDEPSMTLRSNGVTIRGGTVFFALGEVESDIWVADLVEQ